VQPSPLTTSQPAGTPSRELTEFLVELATSLQKRAMYPDGHPMLLATVDRLLARLETILRERPALAIGVARHQLLLEATATDPGNALCRELAARLHRHRIAALRFARGVTADQLGELLARLAVEPTRGQRPLGASPGMLPAWEHIAVEAAGYDRFVLRTDGAPDSGADPAAPTGADGLWLELARLALEGESGDPGAEAGELDRVAAGIIRRIGGTGQAPAVLAQLTRLAESVQGGPAELGPELRARISALISLLEPAALARLMEGGAAAERERFAHAATTTLAADAVVAVAEAAAEASSRSISPHLLRLLRKLGHIAGSGPEPVRPQADAAVRRHVARLLTDWHLEDPNPTAYTGALEAMAQAERPAAVERGADPEPFAVFCTALEVGDEGPRGPAAAAELLRAGRLGEVVTALLRAPVSAAAEAAWQVIATPETLRGALALGGVESELARALIDRLGAAAVDPLFEVLAASDDLGVREAALGALCGLGEAAAARAVALLPDAPWYLQRNLLLLLGRTGHWPDGFSPARYAEHADPRVRREGVKLLLESPGTRDAGLAHGLADPDPGITAVALGAALEHCPPALLPLIERMARDPARRSAHRVLAIRILARSRTPRALESLTSIALPRRRWFLRRRLAPKSPELLAAIAGLAAAWPAEPDAEPVLAQASRHPDAEVRAAAARSG
jgi:ribosomal protein L29